MLIAACLGLGGYAASPAWEPCANEICAPCRDRPLSECGPYGSTGDVDSTSCRKGRQTYRWCGGIGYETGGYKCISYFGDGRIPCRRCHKTLYAPCRKCEGTEPAKCGRGIELPGT